MARIRSLKPEFFLDEGLVKLSPAHRLLFAGLWLLADKEGRLEDSPQRIKAQLFPYEPMPVDEMLTDLDDLGPIHRYTIEERPCIAIPNFKKHQRPHPKEAESCVPAPPSREKKRLAVKGFSDIPSCPPGKGREGKESWEGKGRNISDLAGKPPVGSAVVVSDAVLAKLAPGVVVFEHWRRVMGKSDRCAYDANRKGKVEARLRDGFSPQDLMLAVDGCSQTPHNMGENDRGERFDDLALICRDAAHVERFRANATAPPKGKAGPPRGAATAADKDWSKPVKTITTEYGEELDLGAP